MMNKVKTALIVAIVVLAVISAAVGLAIMALGMVGSLEPGIVFDKIFKSQSQNDDDKPLVFTPTVQGGIAYTDCGGDYLYKIDAKTGKLIDKLKAGNWITYVIRDTVICALDDDNNFHTIRLSDGKDQAKLKLKESMQALMTVADGKAFLVDDYDYLHAIDIKTGDEIWKSREKFDAGSIPARGDGILCTAGTNGTFYTLETSSGQEKWRIRTGDVASSPVLANGIMYISSAPEDPEDPSGEESTGGLKALDEITGRELWHFDPPGGASSSASISDGIACFSSGHRILYAIDSKTGEKKWDCSTKFNSYFEPTIESGTVYFATDNNPDHYLYAVNLANGKQLWKTKIGRNDGYAPAVSNGLVYVGCYGKLMAIDAKTGKLKWDFEVKEKVKD